MPVGFLRQRRNALIVASTLLFIHFAEVDLGKVVVFFGGGEIGNKDGAAWCFFALLAWLTIRFFLYYFSNSERNESFKPLVDIPSIREVVESLAMEREELYQANYGRSESDIILDFYVEQDESVPHKERLRNAVLNRAKSLTFEENDGKGNFIGWSIAYLENSAKEFDGGWDDMIQYHVNKKANIKNHLEVSGKLKTKTENKIKLHVGADRARIWTDVWVPGIYLVLTVIVMFCYLIKGFFQ